MAIGRTISTLHFDRWISAGIVKIKNLRFIDGILDENFVYAIVRDKRDILSEMSKLKLALKPYAQYIGSNEPCEDTHVPLFTSVKQSLELQDFKDCKSKFFYKACLAEKAVRPISEQYWQHFFELNDDDFKKIYRLKIVQVKDKKIAEFNFKTLHNILPCNMNLVRWKKKNDRKCHICNVDEDVMHMLFYCNFAQSIWKHVSNFLETEIGVSDVIVGSDISKDVDFLISLTSYFIYKCWLKESFDGVIRDKDSSKTSFLAYLAYRIRLYKSLQYVDYIKIINRVITQL